MKRENSSAAATTKENIRRKMRARLRGMDPAARAEASLRICRQAAGLPAFRAAKTVALFAPLSSEPDIHPLIEEAWARGKRVVFPLMLEGREIPALEWRQAANWDEMIAAGPFGIREPDPIGCGCVEAAGIGLVLVPGLAFDNRGVRLGRGGGYYDSALAGLASKTACIGLMFACQQVPEVPREEHDQALKSILTEEGLVSLTGD